MQGSISDFSASTATALFSKVRLWDLQCVTSITLHRASSQSPNSSQETAETQRVWMGWRRYFSRQSKSYRGLYRVKGTRPWLFYPWAMECRYEVGAGFYILDSPRSVFSGRFSWSLSSHLLAIHLFLPFFYVAETHPQNNGSFIKEFKLRECIPMCLPLYGEQPTWILMFNPHNKHSYCHFTGETIESEKIIRLESRKLVLFTLYTVQIHLPLLGIERNKK